LALEVAAEILHWLVIGHMARQPNNPDVNAAGPRTVTRRLLQESV
jgi:hypothetical protein